MKRLPTLIAAALAFRCFAAPPASQPFRLSVSPDRTTWSLEERAGLRWRPLLSGARVKALRPDGSEIAFDGISLTPGGKSLMLKSPDLTLKVIVRWLDAKRLPGTVVLLPQAFAKGPGIELGLISVVNGAVLAPLSGKPVALVNGFGSGDRPEVKMLEAGASVLSWWVTALHGPARSCVAGYLSSVAGVNSLTLDSTTSRIALTDKSDLDHFAVSTSSVGTSMDALYLAWGKSPTAMLKQYAAAARRYAATLDAVQRVRNSLNVAAGPGAGSRWKGILEAERRRLKTPR